jgi:hypothetical protein
VETIDVRNRVVARSVIADRVGSAIGQRQKSVAIHVRDGRTQATEQIRRCTIFECPLQTYDPALELIS